MNDNPERPDIYLEDSNQQAAKVRDQADQVEKELEERFLAPVGLEMLKQFLAESQLVSPTERAAVKDWTIDDIVGLFDKRHASHEKDVRKHMAGDFMNILESQDEISGSRDPRMQALYRETRDFTFTILTQVLQSDDEIAERFPVGETETRYAAELLEAIRQTVIQPPGHLIFGYNEGPITSIPSFFDDVWARDWDNFLLDELPKRLDDDEGRRRRIEERIRKNLESRTAEEWDTIIELEGRYCLEYLQQRAVRARGSIPGSVAFLSRLTSEGKRIFSDEEIDKMTGRGGALDTLVGEIRDIEDFREVLPWIKQTLGSQASYAELLKMM